MGAGSEKNENPAEFTIINDYFRGYDMQFYWRIIEELKFLGETLIFHDPTLLRQFNWWLRKNSGGLALSETDYRSGNVTSYSAFGISPSLN